VSRENTLTIGVDPVTKGRLARICEVRGVTQAEYLREAAVAAVEATWASPEYRQQHVAHESLLAWPTPPAEEPVQGQEQSQEQEQDQEREQEQEAPTPRPLNSLAALEGAPDPRR